MSLNHGEVANSEGNYATGAQDAIEFTPDPQHVLVPYKPCIDACKENSDCRSFSYCPPSDNLNPDKLRCHLKDKFFTHVDEPSHKDTINNCFTVFNKCEEGRHSRL